LGNLSRPEKRIGPAGDACGCPAPCHVKRRGKSERGRFLDARGGGAGCRKVIANGCGEGGGGGKKRRGQKKGGKAGEQPTNTMGGSFVGEKSLKGVILNGQLLEGGPNEMV